MEPLRRIWLIALAAGAAVGALCAVAMRCHLLTPSGTLTADTYNDLFTLHSTTMATALLGALVAIPTCILRPTRHTPMIGAAAFILWAVATVVAVTARPDWLATMTAARQLRVATAGLALSSVLAIVQISTSLPRFTTSSITSILALAIVSISLARGELPPRDHLLAAATLSTCTIRPALPCLVAAWLVTLIFHAVHITYLSDTVAAVSPFPALGGAVFIALLPKRARRWTLVLTIGAIATAAGLLILGLRGMPARYYQYDPSFQPLQILVGVAFALTIAPAVRMLR